MFGFIYITTNIANNKRYVGKCTHENPIKEFGNVYLGSGVIIKYAIKKWGRSNFKREILQVCQNEDELNIAEEMWIDKLLPEYNIESGGWGGISNRLKTYWARFTPEERKSLRNWGRKTSVVGENNPMYGKSTSEIVKKVWDIRGIDYKSKFGEKISKSKKGKYSKQNNPMFGRSAIKEQNLKWYNNGIEVKYFPEGSQPIGWKRGRKINEI